MSPTPGVLPKLDFSARCKGHLWIRMNDWFRCSPLGRGQDFPKVTLLESWLTPFSMSTDDSRSPCCPAHPPLHPLTGAKPPAWVHVPVSLHWYSLLLLHSDKHKPAPFAGYFWTVPPNPPSHRRLLLVLCLSCQSFIFLITSPYHYTCPWKMNKKKFCQLHVSVVSCCRPSSDFLLYSYKTQHYKPPYKPHTAQLCSPSGATADTTSTGCSAMPLAPAALLFQLSGMPGFVQTCFLLHI